MSAVWQRRAGIQLAYPFELKRLRSWPAPWIVQPKLNGERMRALCHKSEVLLLSSEENEIHTLPHIQKHLSSLELPDVELDGEVYLHGMSKQMIGSFMRRKSPHSEHLLMQYHLFDIILPDVYQEERLNLLYNTLIVNPSMIRKVDSHKIYAYEDVADLLTAYVSRGYEGIILRNRVAKYERKRTTNMLKWKPRHTDSYLIVGFEEECDKYGIPKNSLGSLRLTKDGEQFSVGSGSLFTREQRNSLWQIRESLPGRWATIRYPELTDRGVPNHPVIVDITEREIEDES